MQIFNKILSKEDSVEFCKQSDEFKIDWILKNTNMQDMNQIMQWINNPPKSIDGKCGCGCGDSKKPDSDFKMTNIKKKKFGN